MSIQPIRLSSQGQPAQPPRTDIIQSSLQSSEALEANLPDILNAIGPVELYDMKPIFVDLLQETEGVSLKEKIYEDDKIYFFRGTTSSGDSIQGVLTWEDYSDTDGQIDLGSEQFNVAAYITEGDSANNRSIEEQATQTAQEFINTRHSAYKIPYTDLPSDNLIMMTVNDHPRSVIRSNNAVSLLAIPADRVDGFNQLTDEMVQNGQTLHRAEEEKRNAEYGTEEYAQARNAHDTAFEENQDVKEEFVNYVSNFPHADTSFNSRRLEWDPLNEPLTHFVGQLNQSLQNSRLAD